MELNKTLESINVSSKDFFVGSPGGIKTLNLAPDVFSVHMEAGISYLITAIIPFTLLQLL